MTQTIIAVYQNGTFKPLHPITDEIVDGEEVRLTIQDKQISPEEMLEMAGHVYEGLSNEEIDEIEKIAFDRTHFFGDREI